MISCFSRTINNNVVSRNSSKFPRKQPMKSREKEIPSKSQLRHIYGPHIFVYIFSFFSFFLLQSCRLNARQCTSKEIE